MRNGRNWPEFGRGWKRFGGADGLTKLGGGGGKLQLLSPLFIGPFLFFSFLFYFLSNGATLKMMLTIPLLCNTHTGFLLVYNEKEM